MKYPLMINCQPLEADVDPDPPLLWVLRDTLKLKGTKFGCKRRPRPFTNKSW